MEEEAREFYLPLQNNSLPHTRKQAFLTDPLTGGM
jgi:hypothetical protein